MTQKRGSSSFSVLLVDGYNLLASKIQNWSDKTEAAQRATHGLGDRWEESTPTGMRKVTLTQAGAFFDDTVGGVHEA